MRDVVGRRLPHLVLAAGVSVAVLGALATVARSQVCSPPLPAGLTTFCPSTPARAEEVNENYRALHRFIEDKVGDVTSPDATIDGDLVVGGAVTMDPGALSDGAVESADVEDGAVSWAEIAPDTLDATHLNPSILGPGLRRDGTRLALDQTWLAAELGNLLGFRETALVSHDGTEDIATAPPRRACGLGRVRMEDRSGYDDFDECHVRRDSANVWTLRAYSSQTGTAPTECRAHCALLEGGP